MAMSAVKAAASSCFDGCATRWLDGDRILAVVCGTAINQDGRSNGLTAPNGPAQQAVIRAALADAAMPPRVVGYVEAHGTGTPLGDPIEVGALAAVLSEGRDATSSVALGSVKTNVGHLEAAAGIAGVIKTVIALERREIPPHLHLQTPNPFIDWKALSIRIPSATIAWSAIEERHVAGVSSFGFSGTNAHVILEAAPVPEKRKGAGSARAEQVLALSARDPQALLDLGRRYQTLLTTWPGGPDASPRDICATANTGRTHFAHRVSVMAGSVSGLADALGNWLQGADDSRVVCGTSGSGNTAPRVAFLFPGQGPQYAGMGRQLYEAAPEFRQAFDECAVALEPLLGCPLGAIVFPDEGAGSLIDQTTYAQPAMFAIEYALAALWRSWGVEPVAVMGHSFGEYAAACVAGLLSLDDAAQMVVARGRLGAKAPGDGLMVIVEASEEEAAEAIRSVGGAVSIAAINGTSNTVISGDRGAVQAVSSRFANQGRRTTPLRVSHAFHSPLMDPVLDDFAREVATVTYSAPTTTIVSSLIGKEADFATIGRAAYWRDHLRQPVRFVEAMRTLADKGITHYVEMSPHSVLLGMGADCVTGGTWLASLRQEHSAWQEMLRSLQTLYADGATVKWSNVERGQSHDRIPLPTYPFQRRRHWIDTVAVAPAPGAKAPVDFWSTAVRVLDREAPRGPLDLDAASYPAKWNCLARLTDALVVQTLQELGAFTNTGERHSLESLLHLTGIVPAHRRLASRWLDRLARMGFARRDGDMYERTGYLPDATVATLWEEADDRFRDNRELLSYVRNCADHLSAIVTGSASALESLFPGGSFDMATALYERSAMMRYVNGLAASVLTAVHQAIPAGQDLCVLEVGAGTGGTTSALLRALPAERTRYRFTDVSEVFLQEARLRFSEHQYVEFGILNLETDPTAQGYEPGSFDVVVAANAVHAVRDLPVALQRLRALLAPGGVLVLVESTVHLDYFDVTTGLIEGWQHFADDVRGDNPLLAPEAWIEALRAAGMSEARAWPERGSLPDVFGQHVIVASAPNIGVRATRPSHRADSTTSSTPDELLDRRAETVPAATTARERVESALPSERVSILCDVVRAEVMRVLRLDPASPPSRQDRLMELGMDSLMAVQLRNSLNRTLGLEKGLPSTLIFDHPTIEAIAHFVLPGVASSSAASRPTIAAAQAAQVSRAAPMTATAIADLSDDDIARLLLEREGEA